ncbi:GNAT family N-acetyltransferase [Allorhizocola rhizosphaerae]|uniref:GNAT family N-acetyltransferase n=1 Tax=Allorhizocola rhizosphaerae TaxID=1872709 RepID=UPI0013C309E6|nr:GNAT family N-acetyltransferase [Allorhizocola rhizosphaerae]
MTQIVVVDAPERSRFEALEAGELVGICDYHRSDGVITLDRVEVVPAQRGRGIGEQIVQAAVTAARAENLEVIPHCWFAAAWLRSHPQRP